MFVPELDEHYHSIHGALQESLHVFIQAGFSQFISKKKELRILEIGFGTGLNAILTLKEAEVNNLKTEYHSIEKYPVTLEEMESLNYQELLEDESLKSYFPDLHKCPWNELVSVNSHFSIKKLQDDLKSILLEHNYFDLIYFDAFAPSAQADLWSIDIFKKMFNCLKPEGILVTYCVKGVVRRNMIAAGFEVEKIPGPPGKREMARAQKPLNHE